MKSYIDRYWVWILFVVIGTNLAFSIVSYFQEGKEDISYLVFAFIGFLGLFSLLIIDYKKRKEERDEQG
ncbi:hypothetical protein ACTWQB_00725 [Piscibacillus sp. B03]|uniref:hypothetical protein n=1 Tax=Piscibacillus sp. B03 TaxID=3457430 RepID=UPI003FCEBB89